MKLWIMYDDTPAQLPLWVADTLDEMAEVSGRSKSTVCSIACRVRSGEIKNGKYASVEVDDE